MSQELNSNRKEKVSTGSSPAPNMGDTYMVLPLKMVQKLQIIRKKGAKLLTEDRYYNQSVAVLHKPCSSSSQSLIERAGVDSPGLHT